MFDRVLNTLYNPQRKISWCHSVLADNMGNEEQENPRVSYIYYTFLQEQTL